ncbi:hypothetical protein HUJ04_000027 [Dendroctonus ponderosae]
MAMFAHHATIDDNELDSMQRIWQGGRRKESASTAFFQGSDAEDLLAPSSEALWPIACTPHPQDRPSSDGESDSELQDYYEPSFFGKPCLELDGAALNDLPAHYTICSLQAHQFPVCGVYIDKRIVPGFKYKVRPLPPVGERSTLNKCLFKGKALRLQTIGRGFARRITFESDDGRLNCNDNYFYSDNRPEGYAFELELLSPGDKFTIFDMNHQAQGTVEVLNIEGPELEIASALSELGIEKRANVKFTGKVEFYDTGVAKPVLLSGLVVAVKAKGQPAAIVSKVCNVHIKRQKLYLIPGIKNDHRRVTVRGLDINDVPTKYTMTGLQPYELPVVGTYVDPRVIPGFSYRVRPNHKTYHLFGGRALRLLSIGMGYAKRLTFEPDTYNNPQNFMWSDNHPDGLGLEPRAVAKGMKFMVKAGGHVIGEATVFRDDNPQFEEKSEKIKTKTGQWAIEKHIHVDVICHVQLSRPGGASSERDSYMMRISGVALARLAPGARRAHIVDIHSIGLDSELYVLFTQTCTEITFLPKGP